MDARQCRFFAFFQFQKIRFCGRGCLSVFFAQSITCVIYETKEMFFFFFEKLELHQILKNDWRGMFGKRALDTWNQGDQIGRFSPFGC
jgi:hypothetical protein